MNVGKYNIAGRSMRKMFAIADGVNWKARSFIASLLGKSSLVNDAQLNTILDMVSSYRAVVQQLALQPMRTTGKELELLKDHVALLRVSIAKLFGMPTQPVIEPAKGDHRFADKDWQTNPLFDYLKQAYLLNSRTILELVESLEDTDHLKQEQFIFFTRQLVNALAPTNFVLTNPQVLRKTIDTKGANLLTGVKNLVGDVRSNPKMLNIAMTDFSAFEVGKNLATTPGKVIFQNELLQLIQYSPTTEKVCQTPLLIIPPWINKYYILDMKEENSLVKWLVDQGHTVFIISWVNPGPELRDIRFEDYMTRGSLAALDAVKKATGEPDANLIGYCVGGTLLSATLAYLANKRKAKQVKSATYLTTLIDFSDPGGIGVFVNETSVNSIERMLSKKGFFDGRAMAFSFNLLRENDLFWSFFVNNYLLGEKPQPFDLLFWNSDGTNLPAAMHGWYLRNMYLENKFIEPNGITLADTPVDHRKIKTPVYFLSTIQDHIAKWKSTYTATQVHSGDVTFVLSGSGHIAGVVNPPVAQKYCFWTNEELPKDPDEWLENADKHPGSWWPHWNQWIQTYTGEQVEARIPGDHELEVIEDAPGAYVKTKIADVID